MPRGGPRGATDVPSGRRSNLQRPSNPRRQSSPRPPEQPAVTDAPATAAAPAAAPDAGMTEAQKAAADAVAARPTVTPEAAVPTAIVSDEITPRERALIREAERTRRSEQRKRRRTLIGAAAAGLAVGAIAGRLGGRVVEDQGDRLIVEREDGTYLVRRDENELLRGDGSIVSTEQLDDDRQRTIVTRPNGVEVVTLRDGFGNILRRTKRLPNGDEIVLIDNQVIEEVAFEPLDLGPVTVPIARDEYIVSAERADEEELRETFVAAPVEDVERVYSLREVRGSERLREKVRRVDLDAITFDTGSATVTRSQVRAARRHRAGHERRDRRGSERALSWWKVIRTRSAGTCRTSRFPTAVRKRSPAS